MDQSEIALYIFLIPGVLLGLIVGIRNLLDTLDFEILVFFDDPGYDLIKYRRRCNNWLRLGYFGMGLAVIGIILIINA